MKYKIIRFFIIIFMFILFIVYKNHPIKQDRVVAKNAITLENIVNTTVAGDEFIIITYAHDSDRVIKYYGYIKYDGSVQLYDYVVLHE